MYENWKWKKEEKKWSRAVAAAVEATAMTYFFFHSHYKIPSINIADKKEENVLMAIFKCLFSSSPCASTLRGVLQVCLIHEHIYFNRPIIKWFLTIFKLSRSYWRQWRSIYVHRLLIFTLRNNFNLFFSVSNFVTKAGRIKKKRVFFSRSWRS